MRIQSFLAYCASCTFTLSVIAAQRSTNNCESDSECDQGRLLACNSEHHKFDCKSGITIYDRQKGECALISRAICDNGKENQCVSHAKCENRKCKCKPDYFANPKGECERKKPFNGTCTSENECQVDGKGSPFICNAGRCVCNSAKPLFSADFCSLPVGSDCSEISSSACVANSHCESSDDYDEWLCTCNSDFFKTSLGTCEQKRSHGATCDSNAECSGELICDSVGICECNKLPHVYDPIQSSCVLPLGSECELHIARMSQKCVTYAKCRPSRTGIGNGHPATCQCDFGKNLNGTCVSSHRGICGKENRKCNEEEQGTICNEGVCSCKNGVFDEQKEKCVSSVFGFCDDSAADCISNSHCAPDPDPQGGNKIMKKCVCNEGFVPVDYSCVATIGQRCNYTKINERGRSTGNCDPISSLRCINGTCQCGGEKEYDFGMRKCKGLVGSYCEVSDKNYCIENSECILRWTYLTMRGRCECKSGWETSKERKCDAKLSVLPSTATPNE
ncbi:unnamed protein product [Orchesella dallaii]|uniref:EGF-like domain-containing protein n=1 Tax=Orchesella dallaii TaxID=48710 RepID=A0ABP1S565_9HEXA